jgi:cyclopropane-fatty-acyl-phospholipid synthase
MDSASRRPSAAALLTGFRSARRRVAPSVLQQWLLHMDAPLRVVLPDGAALFSRGATDSAPTLIILNPRFFERVPWGGSIGLGESYMASEWESDDLVGVCGALGASVVTAVPAPIRWGRRWFGQRVVPGAVGEATDNAAAHYERPNELFELFLDDTMSYSCALFDGTGDLEEAQRLKYESICALADIRKTDHVLDLGVGWAGFAIHAAATRGCRVTGISLTPDQQAWARRRVEAAGVQELVTLEIADYREYTGSFDVVVSLEMFEHVGQRYWQEYFERCAAMLRPTGRMAMQTITESDRYFRYYGRSMGFINKHIFPGGMLSSVRQLRRTIAQSPFRLSESREIGQHYVPTLAEWRRRFDANQNRIETLGFGQSFRRMWELYLAGSQAMFDQRTLGDVQLLLTP